MTTTTPKLLSALGAALALTVSSTGGFSGVMGIAAAAPPAASAAAPPAAAVSTLASRSFGQRVVAEAARHAGKPYSYGAAGPSRFDCSGFTAYVFARLGKQLPHNSGAQRAAVRRVANGDKQPGDLIFTSRGGRITHVGIYAGGANMWSPVQTGDRVRLQSFGHRTYSVGRVG